MRLAAVLHREDQAQGAGRMSGNENGSYALVAKSDGHALEGNHVSFRQRYRQSCISARRRWARNVYEIPIGRGHEDVCAVMLLQICRPAKMIFVAMGQDDHLDIGGVQAKSL